MALRTCAETDIKIISMRINDAKGYKLENEA